MRQNSVDEQSNWESAWPSTFQGGGLQDSLVIKICRAGLCFWCGGIEQCSFSFSRTPNCTNDARPSIPKKAATNCLSDLGGSIERLQVSLVGISHVAFRGYLLMGHFEATPLSCGPSAWRGPTAKRTSCSPLLW